MSITNTSAIYYQTKTSAASAANSTNKTDSSDGFRNLVQESVVDEFKRKNPDHASHVDQQVRNGRAVREKYGRGISTEDMSMAEYQAYFYALLDTIPYDYTQMNNTVTISISDKGWEQMRKDPDYEAWILGYFVEDRAVRNPFFGWGDNAGSIVYERFGASIEEHRGDGFSKAALRGSKPDDDDDDEEEDWWIKRHKRMKKLLKEQVERSLQRDMAQEAAAREEYARQQYESSMRQHSFLTTGSPDSKEAPTAGSPAAAMAAAAAYGSILDLFVGNPPM